MEKNTKITSVTNRIYKDRLFCAIFGREEHKSFLLELYNALNGSNYTDVHDLDFTTIENAIYITMKNDVSFLIGSQLNLYEQQSSYNPNMPLRGLLYFSQLYQMYLTKNDLDFYSSSIVKIPTPKFIVFYNGNKEIPDITKLKLSNSFEQEDNSKEFEWTATVYNINKKHNATLLKKCKPLYDYSEFIAQVKSNLLCGQDKQTAIINAVDFAIKNNYLNGYFRIQQSEVLGMSLTEFNQEEYDRHRKNEWLAEGEKRGIKQAIQNTAKQMKADNMSIDTIMKYTNLSKAEILEL